MNVILFAATATSLIFELDVRYEEGDVLTASLICEKDEFEANQPYYGEKYVTFENLTPDTEYTFRLIRGEDEILFSQKYKTAKPDSTYNCSILTKYDENDLHIGVLFSSELPEFFTVTVTASGGQILLEKDAVPPSPEKDSVSETHFIVRDYPFDQTCSVVVTAGTKGVAVKTLPAVSAIELEKTISDVSLEIRLALRGGEEYRATIGDKDCTVSLMENNIYVVSASDLLSETTYPLSIYIDGKMIFRKDYTTAKAESPAITATEVSSGISDTALSVVLSLSGGSAYSATIDNQGCSLEQTEDKFILFASGLTAETDYTITVYSGNDLVLQKVYTTAHSPSFLVSSFKQTEDGFTLMYTIENPDNIGFTVNAS